MVVVNKLFDSLVQNQGKICLTAKCILVDGGHFSNSRVELNITNFVPLDIML
jgi:hypothetical protein